MKAMASSGMIDLFRHAALLDKQKTQDFMDCYERWVEFDFKVMGFILRAFIFHFW